MLIMQYSGFGRPNSFGSTGATAEGEPASQDVRSQGRHAERCDSVGTSMDPSNGRERPTANVNLGEHKS